MQLVLRPRRPHERGFGRAVGRLSLIHIWPEGAGGASDGDGAPREGAWTKSCNALAEQAGLSLRERDVLFLLGKGYTIEYIAGELGISFNLSLIHI